MQLLLNYKEVFKCIKPEPIMLLILPIIPSRNSHNFYPLFLFYSHAITYYSCYIFNFCVSDNEVHSLLSS